MSIIYGLVAHGATILAEHTNSSGNFATVTQAILEKIPPNNSKLTYVYDRYLFHYICEDGITYMCMADDSFGRRVPFAFLQDLKDKFLSAYPKERALHSPPYGMNEFSRTIAKQMEYFSTNPGSDRLKQVHGEIEQVKDVMVHNIERVLERGERIELLVDKTDNLNQQAFAFKKRSTQLKSHVVEKYKVDVHDCIGMLFDRVLCWSVDLWSSIWFLPRLNQTKPEPLAFVSDI